MPRIACSMRVLDMTDDRMSYLRIIICMHLSTRCCVEVRDASLHVRLFTQVKPEPSPHAQTHAYFRAQLTAAGSPPPRSSLSVVSSNSSTSLCPDHL